VKRFLISRRGAAIEMAIGMMFLVMALTIILLTNGLLQASHAKDDLNDFEEKIVYFEIEDYVKANKPKEVVEYKGYTITPEGNRYIVVDKNNNTVFTIGLNAADNTEN